MRVKAKKGFFHKFHLIYCEIICALFENILQQKQYKRYKRHSKRHFLNIEKNRDQKNDTSDIEFLISFGMF